MSSSETFQVRVKSVTWEADGIVSFDLRPMPPRKDLPAFSAGSHIDVHLPNGTIRSYSLLNSQDERHRYVIGVNRDASSRGGSRFMHETLRAGDALAISAPRNNFELDESAAHTVLIAGGIGITPLMSMIERLRALGRPWQLYYAARTRQNCAFVDLLQGLRDREGADVHFTFDKEPGAKMLDIPGIVAALPAGRAPLLLRSAADARCVRAGREVAAAPAGARRILRGARERRHGRRLHRRACAHQAQPRHRPRPHHSRQPDRNRHRAAVVLPRGHLRHLRNGGARRAYPTTATSCSARPRRPRTTE